MRAEALEIVRRTFEWSGNPYYVWYAIYDCINTNTTFPDWIVAYLSQCSERMMSEKAGRASDLRKVLPWVFGFPRKHGPGNLLNPQGNPERLSFALEFGTRVLNGEDPVRARRDACNAVFDGKDAEVDDKTLVRWLLDVFGVKKAPKNTTGLQKLSGHYCKTCTAAVGHDEGGGRSSY
jgi:hypothetical protein